MDHHAPPGGFFNWFKNSANHPSENPEHCSYPQYPYSYPHVSPTPQNFFEPTGFNPYCPMPATSSSEAPQVFADGQGDDEEEEDDEQNIEEEDNRNRRLSWTEADDIRLVSAWLNNSVDPLQGNNKKGDVYWKSVTDEYNRNSPPNRRRQPKHCKDHWGKSNKKVALFNGIWFRLRDAHESGQSVDQIKEKALALYKQETKQSFTLEYWWKEVRDQAKWTNNYYKGKKNKKEMIDLEETRPMGREAAKAKAKTKAAMPDSYLSHDDLQMYHDTQAIRASTAEKTADVQLRLSRDKVEAAQSRERTSMAQMYTNLLMADLSGMTDMQRVEHQKALRYFGSKIYD